MAEPWRTLSKAVVLTLMGFVLVIAYSIKANAEWKIVHSNVAGIQSGIVIDKNAILDIPANGQIRVLELSAKVTKTIKGPFKGKVVDYGPSRFPNLFKKPPVESDYGSLATLPRSR